LTSYRIEKLRCPVMVMFAGGEVVEGDVVLSPASRSGAGPQAPWDFLNELDPYFALDPADGHTMLAAKEQVVWVELSQPAANADAGAGHPVPVEVTLTAGPPVSGSLLVGAPTSHARVLDYLNANRERFLCVVQPDRVILVNRGAIVHVHELS
jgi:hypothetical protein